MTSDHELASASGVDPTVPSAARGYDYLLGGKDNFAVDRLAAEMLMSVAPEAPVTARANRAFGGRAVRFMAEQGIRQFIDLGSGIPTTPPAVHEVARSIHPDARVVYVDDDPVVVSHSNALRSVHHGLATVLGDIRQPDDILRHPELTERIDFREPVAVVIFSVLHVIESQDDPYGIVTRFRDHMAAGSYLGISHLSARSDPAAVEHAHAVSAQTGFPHVEFRSDEEVMRFFGGFDLVDPGLVDITEWRPTDTSPPTGLTIVGAVGRKT